MENTPAFDISKVIEDARSIIINPVDFYQKMSKTGGFIEPLIYVVVMAAIAAGIMFILSLIGGKPVGIGILVILPIMMAVASFISAGIIYLIWKIMGSGNDYEAAYRCVAYSMAILPVSALLSIVPFIGLIVPALWGAYLMITASTEVHGLDKQKASMVFGALALLSIFVNMSTQRAVNNMEDQLDKVGGLAESMKDMTPEEAGKALGEFQRGFEEATK